MRFSVHTGIRLGKRYEAMEEALAFFLELPPDAAEAMEEALAFFLKIARQAADDLDKPLSKQKKPNKKQSVETTGKAPVVVSTDPVEHAVVC